MHRQELSELAHARDWEGHLHDAKAVVGQAVRTLGERADEVLQGTSGNDGAPLDEGPSDRARRDDCGRLNLLPNGVSPRCRQLAALLASMPR
jgi:hypothetical protein